MVHRLRPWGQKPCGSNYDKEVLVAYSMHKGKGYSGAEVDQWSSEFNTSHLPGNPKQAKDIKHRFPTKIFNNGGS